MSVVATTHINLRGNARAALAFYQTVFGGRLDVVSYGDVGADRSSEGAEEVMWGQVDTGDGFRVMAFDAPATMPWDQGQNAYFVSARSSSEQQIKERWQKLSEGAEVRQPLAPAPWSPLYGMLKDRFGVVWVLDVASAQPTCDPE